MEQSYNLEARSYLENCNIKNGIVCEEKLQNYTTFNDDGRKSLLYDLENKGNHASESINKMEFMLCTLLFNRINLILLAGIINILLLLKLNNLFGQVILHGL